MGEWAVHAKHGGVIIVSGGRDAQNASPFSKKHVCVELFSCRPAERSADPDRMMLHLRTEGCGEGRESAPPLCPHRGTGTRADSACVCICVCARASTQAIERRKGED